MARADPRPRALVVADSDSYLKWAVQRVGDLTPSFRTDVVVVDNAVTPSAGQRVSAVDGRLPSLPEVIALPRLVELLRDDPPDLLLLACRGPLIEVLLLEELHGVPAATVVAAGIPGIWFPPTELGIELRSCVDLLVVHSQRERRAVGQYLPRGRITDVGLASLPRMAGGLGGASRPRIVFAPQALIPPRVEDRRLLLDALAELARAHPDLDVVIKLRGSVGEAQTHAEHAAYPDLAAERADLPDNLVFADGPLREFLGDCVGFVTVSSTAALEAIEADVPTLIISEFGVNAAMINLVFEGSGLLGDLSRLVAGEFRHPDPEWLQDNYFHPAEADDWTTIAHRRIAEGPYRDRGAPVHDVTGLRTLPHRIRRRWVALGSADTLPRRLVTTPVHGAALAVQRGIRWLRPGE